MEDIVRKIRKLLHMTPERGCTEEEAAIAARKVQELLIEHDLSLAEVTQPEPDREVVVEEDLTGAERAWHGYIAVAVAKVYFCRVLRLGRTLRFVGKSHHTAVAREMCQYLYATVERLAGEAAEKVPGPRRRAFRNSFRLGAATRLGYRLNELYRQATQPKPTPGHGRGSAPVAAADERLPALYQREERMVDAYLQRRYGRLRKGKTSSHISSGEGYRAGHEAAGSVSLNPQICGGTRAGRLIFRRIAMQPSKKMNQPCPHCGEHHIQSGTPQDEYQQVDQCRQQEPIDIQAERLEWYESHWDRDD